MNLDKLHLLLTSRFVCEACTTRLYAQYFECPGCKKCGFIRPLYAYLHDFAESDDEFRDLILGGQRRVMETSTQAQTSPTLS